MRQAAVQASRTRARLILKRIPGSRSWGGSRCACRRLGRRRGRVGADTYASDWHRACKARGGRICRIDEWTSHCCRRLRRHLCGSATTGCADALHVAAELD